MNLPDTSTLLIVDDDRGGREALEALLSTQGYNLLLASSGQDALSKLAEKQIDLVLLDVMMPGMDGYEVCRRIRSDAAMADMPVLMLTALNDYRSRLAGFEVGADDYITKPYDSTELFARVRTITRLNRYRRQAAERASEIDNQERMQLASALAREQTLLKTLLEILPDFVYSKDLEGRYVFVNPAMAGLLGLESSADAVGKTDFDFYPKELAMRYSSDEQHMLATGKPITGQEEPAVDVHGNWLVVASSKIILRDKDGEPIGIIGFGNDITGQRKVEHERDQAQAGLVAVERQVEELNARNLKNEELHNQFLASLVDQITHLGQELEKKAGEAHEMVGGIPDTHQTIVDLLAIAKDLNEYTRLAKSPVETSNVQFSLSDCVRNSAVRAAGAKDLESAPVDISLAANLPDQVAGDRDGLSQVLARLLHKVLALPENGHPSIQVEEENYDALRHPGQFYIHVMITSPGLLLKNDEILQAFVPYHGPFRDVNDPGLDLAICQRLVEGAGGGIWIENKDLNEKGSAFHFTYPLDIP